MQSRFEEKFFAHIVLEAYASHSLLQNIMLTTTQEGPEAMPAMPEVPKEMFMSNRLQVRALSVAMDAGGNMKKAVALYKARYTGKRPSHLRRFIQGVWNRYCNGDIIMKKHATHRRKRKVSDDVARRAAAMFLEGTQGMSAWRPFFNATEVRHSSPLRNTLYSTDFFYKLFNPSTRKEHIIY